MATADVTIIGGGVIGAAIAWRLAAQGASVCILERGQPGTEASWAAGGILIPDVGHGAPAPLLAHWLTALRMYPDFVAALQAETGMPFEFRISGRLVLAFDERQAEELRQRQGREVAAGVEAEFWSATDVRSAEPAVAPGVAGALFFPGHGLVDNRRLVECLALAVARRGGTILAGRPVTGLLIRGDRVVGVDICGEPHYAGAVINAAGSWAGLIDPRVRVPIAPAKGQILALGARPPLCRRILSFPSGSLTPRSDGRHIFGATVERAGYDKRVTAGAVAGLLAAATAACPALADATLLEAWAGLRPVTPDQLPLVGAGPLEDLYVASGHYTMGILSAPATAEAISGLILAGRSPLPIEAFSPRRFDAETGARPRQD